MTPAETCRANGWVVGDYLAGNEGYGDEIIKITAIGEESILARTVFPHWRLSMEGMWDLSYQGWRKVPEPVAEKDGA